VIECWAGLDFQKGNRKVANRDIKISIHIARLYKKYVDTSAKLNRKQTK
jgi:hypothetical protein